MWQNIKRSAGFTWRRLGDLSVSRDILSLARDIFAGWSGLVASVSAYATFVGGVIQGLPYSLIFVLVLLAFVLVLVVVRLLQSIRQSRRPVAMADRSDSEAELQYLPDRDTELDLAIYLVIHRSAWARWFSAGRLASGAKPVDDKFLLLMATSNVVNKAVDGILEIRGRLPTETQYEIIPRENWRLAYLDVEPNLRRIWAFPVKPCSDVDPERIRRMLSYDSLIVDALQFEKIWPRRDKDTDAATSKLLTKARKAGVDPHEIDKILQA